LRVDGKEHISIHEEAGFCGNGAQRSQKHWPRSNYKQLRDIPYELCCVATQLRNFWEKLAETPKFSVDFHLLHS